MDLTEDALQPEQPEKSEQPENEQLEPEQLEPEQPETEQLAAPADERADAIQSRIAEFNGNLKWKENMVLACLTNEIDEAYRKDWIADSNMFFRRAAILKKRHG